MVGAPASLLSCPPRSQLGLFAGLGGLTLAAWWQHLKTSLLETLRLSPFVSVLNFLCHWQHVSVMEVSLP